MKLKLFATAATTALLFAGAANAADIRPGVDSDDNGIVDVVNQDLSTDPGIDVATENFTIDGDVDLLDIGIAIVPSASFVETETKARVEFSLPLANAITNADLEFFNDGILDGQSQGDGTCGTDATSQLTVLTGGQPGNTFVEILIEGAQDCVRQGPLQSDAVTFLADFEVPDGLTETELQALEVTASLTQFVLAQNNAQEVDQGAVGVARLLADFDSAIELANTNSLTGKVDASTGGVLLVGMTSETDVVEFNTVAFSFDAGELLADTNYGEPFYDDGSVVAPTDAFDAFRLESVSFVVTGLPSQTDEAFFDIDGTNDGAGTTLDLTDNMDGTWSATLTRAEVNDLIANDATFYISVTGDPADGPIDVASFTLTATVDYEDDEPEGDFPNDEDALGLEVFEVPLGAITLEGCRVEIPFFAGIAAEANGFTYLVRLRNTSTEAGRVFFAIDPDEPGSPRVGPFQMTETNITSFFDNLNSDDQLEPGNSIEITGSQLDQIARTETGDVVFTDRLGKRATLELFGEFGNGIGTQPSLDGQDTFLSEGPGSELISQPFPVTPEDGDYNGGFFTDQTLAYDCDAQVILFGPDGGVTEITPQYPGLSIVDIQ